MPRHYLSEHHLDQYSGKKPRDLIPGDVIEWHDKLAIVVSNCYPAETVVPESEANRYCEPGLVILRHQRDDKWVKTHEFTHCLLHIDKPIKTFNGVRVQQEHRKGPFETYEQRTAGQ